MTEFNKKSSNRKRKTESASSPSEESGIVQVDLSKYQFSPPGPMGWTDKEYQKLIDSLKNDSEN